MPDNLTVTTAGGGTATLLSSETQIAGQPGHAQRITLGAGPNLATANVAISSMSTPVDLFADRPSAKERMFQPLDGDIFVGPTGFTAGTGFKVSAGTIIGTNHIGVIRVLAAAAGTVNVRTWEVT
jgi:hypothetical protein